MSDHDEGPVILFFVLRKVCLNEFVPLIKALASTPLRPVLWSDRASVLDAARDEARSLSATVFDDGTPTSAGTGNGLRRPILGRLGAARRCIPQPRVVRALRDADALVRRARLRCGRVLDDVNPRVIVITEDIVRLPTSRVMIAMARRRGIPTLVVPASDLFPHASLKGYVLRLPHLRCSGRGAPLLNRLVARIWPRAAYGEGGVRMLHDSPEQAIIAKIRRVGCANPWVLGGGQSSLLAVRGDLAYGRSVDHGVAPAKVVVTGQPSSDVVFASLQRRASLREELSARWGIDPVRPWILLAVPQLPGNRFLNWEEHLKLVEAFVAALAATTEPVVLSFHPEEDPGSYEILKKRYDVTVSDMPTRDVLSACDLFVSKYSSTRAWALLCGIPTLNLHMGVSPAIAQEDNRGGWEVGADALEEVARRCLRDPEFRDDLLARQRVFCRGLGPFDGRASERVTALIEHLAHCGCVLSDRRHDLRRITELISP